MSSRTCYTKQYFIVPTYDPFSTSRHKKHFSCSFSFKLLSYANEKLSQREFENLSTSYSPVLSNVPDLLKK